MRSSSLVLLLICAAISPARAQQSAGSIAGHIRLATPDEAESIRVRAEEVTTEAQIEQTEVNSAGDFDFRSLPFATYDIYAVSENGVAFLRRVVVHSSVPVRIVIDSLPNFSRNEIVVTDTHIEPTQPEVHTLFTTPVIQSLPVTNTAKGIEAILLNSPGIVPDEDGRLHMRGEDAMLQYVIDGIPITSNQTRIYAPLFDANFVESADLLRGAFDPEYGVATAGVLNITTKSGFDASNFGHAEYSIGSFGNSSEGVDYGGHFGQAFGYYFAYGNFSSDRYLDPVNGFDSASPHTSGSGSDYFGKINIIATDKLDITALGYYAHTVLGIPNSYTGSLQDQDMDMISTVFGLRANYSLSNSSVLSLLGYTRRQNADETSNGLDRIDAGDSAQHATALQNERYFVGAHREDIENGAQLEYSAKTDWFGDENEFKLGVGGEIFPISEYFTFAVTDSNLSSPNFPGGDPRLIPYDLTKGGKPFFVDTSATGKRISGYAQDRVTYGDWTVSGGLRYDLYDFLDQESGFSPRLNAIYRASDRLVLRASYNRMFMQAPVENDLVSSSAEAAQLVGAEQGDAPRIVQSEKSNVFEVGAGYRLNKYVNLDLTGYGKLIDDMIVKVELGNSGIIFPANIKNGIVGGGDLEVLLRDWNHFSGRLEFSTIVSKGVVPSDGSSPFAAGLVLGEEGESYSNPFKGEDMFNTEHNQLLTASFALKYDFAPGFFGLLSGRFDSGLPFDLVAPNEDSARAILKTRGYSDATINLLDLSSDMPGSPDRSVKPHATFDASAGASLARFGLPITLIGSIINILNTPYLIKFESTFGGTHFGTPRMVLLRAELTP